MGISFYMPDSAPSAIGGIDSYTKLMLHMDGDQSDSQHPMTFTGNPQLSTVQSKFGGGSLYLDGVGEYLTAPDSGDWTWGTSDLTIEAWVYFEAFPNSYQHITSQWQNSSKGHMFFYEVATDLLLLSLGNGSTGQIIGVNVSWNPSAGQWYHVAVSRDGDNFRFFINGTQQGSTQVASGSVGNSSALFRVGCYESVGIDTNSLFNGWIEEVRISDTARYTTNFSVQTSPHTSDANTSLLLHLNGDASDSAHVVTSNGNPQLNAATTKFNGSMYFDGSDILTIPDDEDWNFGTGDFTIDLWFNTTGGGLLINQQQTEGAHAETAWTLYVHGGTGEVEFVPDYWALPSQHTLNSTAKNDGTWHHVAAVRDDAYIRLYIDGSEVDSWNCGSGFSMIDVAHPLRLGTMGSPSHNNPYTGYVDEVRVSKGIARWTSNFTPETGPYTE